MTSDTEEFDQRKSSAAQIVFSATAQQVSDQQAFRSGGGFVADQFGQRSAERIGHLTQHQDRGIAHAKFEIGEMALGNLRGARQGATGHAAARTKRPGPLPESHQKGIAFGRAMLGIQSGVALGIARRISRVMHYSA